jgi:hypothetical protein
MKKALLSSLLAAGLLFVSAAASASVGAVKIETFGNTSIQLGTICDTFSSGSHPIGIACEVVADPGAGSRVACGTGTCTPFGAILRSDTFGAYCQDTGGNDAIVFCTTSATPGPLAAPSPDDTRTK